MEIRKKKKLPALVTGISGVGGSAEANELSKAQRRSYLDKHARDILAELRCLNVSAVYTVGCLEDFHVSIPEQQARALNLVWSLAHQKLIKKGTGICVIGGGIAGCTAAVAAAMLGARVHLYESGDSLLPLFREASTRWIHPNFYDERLLESDWTDLPILNWKSDFALNMRKLFLHKFENYLFHLSDNLSVFFGSKALGFNLEYRDLEGPSNHDPIPSVVLGRKDGRRSSVFPESYDVNIIATGFGQNGVSQNVVNRREPIVTPSYWSARKLRMVSKKGISKPRILVSGTGDGGIVELIRYSTKSFDHSRFRRLIPKLPRREMMSVLSKHQSFYEQLLVIRTLNNADFHQLKATGEIRTRLSLEQFRERKEEEANLKMAKVNRAFARAVRRQQPVYMKLLEGKIDSSRVVTLNSGALTPYNPFTSAWNQMVLALLEELGAFKYVSGRVSSVSESENGELKVTFSRKGQRSKTLASIDFDFLVQRYKQQSDFGKLFSNLVFNPLQQQLKCASLFGGRIEESFNRKIKGKYRGLIEESDRIESIHSYRKRLKTKKTAKRLFRFRDHGSKFRGKKSGKQMAGAFAKFASKCRHSDLIFIDLIEAFPDVAFRKSFRKAATRLWRAEYPRYIFLDSKTHEDPRAFSCSEDLCWPPFDFYENYLEAADQYYGGLKRKR